MKAGDFSDLARAYIHRPGYSHTVLTAILQTVRSSINRECRIADVGAGTGKLSQDIAALGLSCIAVEPNESMRVEGMKICQNLPVTWMQGSGEDTHLPDTSIDWLLMGSSFHWVDLKKGLAEFHRVIAPGGFFTALWNPRDIEKSEFHLRIEEKINALVPDLKRVSSGAKHYTEDMFDKLVSTNQFADPIFMEAPHQVVMSPERYLGAWRSVNDIQSQAGPERFQEIMRMIESEIKGLSQIIVPYRTRAWTARRID